MSDYGHWELAEGLVLEEGIFGFVYEITNVIENKKYIGKKQCVSKQRKKPLKGKTRKRLVLKESDWKTYTSSSEKLNEDILRLGKENFKFKILCTGYGKWELAYFEIKEQLLRDVLLREDYYNGIVNVRIGKAPRDFIARMQKTSEA